MPIEYEIFAEPSTFEEFLVHKDIVVIVKERPLSYNLPRYYAYATGVEIKEGSILISIHGNGNTQEEALQELKRELAGGKLLVKNAYKSDREEFYTPNEWSEK